MVYLEYEKESRYVVEIHEETPNTVPMENDYAISNEFSVGDEFKYLIIVNSVDENRTATSVSSIQQARTYSVILKENKGLKQRQEATDNAVLQLLMEGMM